MISIVVSAAQPLANCRYVQFVAPILPSVGGFRIRELWEPWDR